MNEDGIAAVILAAGASSRMEGIKKEYQKLSTGASVLETALRAFASVPSINEIVITICADDEASARGALPPDFFSASDTSPRESFKPEIIFVKGGATRRDSALNALRALVPFNPRYVLIHDGARPWVSPALIENIINAVKKYDAVIPLLPVVDTPKECEIRNEDQRESLERDVVFIKRHLKRASVGAAQTPQAFKFQEILNAFEKAAGLPDEEFTDDAEVWARFAGKVASIPGDPANKKITFKEDLN